MLKKIKRKTFNSNFMGIWLGVHVFIVPGVGNGNPFQYSCLEYSKDRGALKVIVHGVTKSWTQLSTHVHIVGKRNS